MGQPVSVNWTVTNTGSSSADQTWSDGVYYSTKSTFDNSAVLLTTVPVGDNAPLAAGGSYMQSGQVTLPSGVAAGTYYFLVYTDVFNQQQETDKNDNTAASAAVAVTGADLTVSSVTVPTSAIVGQSFVVNWTVENIGAASADKSWVDGIYFSTKSTLDLSAGLLRSIASGNNSPLAAGDSYMQSAK